MLVEWEGQIHAKHTRGLDGPGAPCSTRMEAAATGPGGFHQISLALPCLESGPAEAQGGSWGGGGRGVRGAEGCRVPPAGSSHHQLSHTEAQQLCFTVPTSGPPPWPCATTVQPSAGS